MCGVVGVGKETSKWVVEGRSLSASFIIYKSTFTLSEVVFVLFFIIIN